MSGISQDEWTNARRAKGVREAALGAVRWLHLAAAPIFALMAGLTFALGGEAQPMTCLGGGDASPISGMGLMYLLMSVFHAAPWLKFVAYRR
ncbi:hypothetical protein [Bordetella tumulicola]|uniref:hypothetical protein n=1 Tax=Bordetella tumulicola TaxID=1649133 RepID=UPI0039EFD2EC